MKTKRSDEVMHRADYVRERCWVLLARNKKTGEILGQTEESFSMKWSKTHVNVIRPYLLGKFRTHDDCTFTREQYNKACSDYIDERQRRLSELGSDTHDLFYARVGSKNCPIKIDWESFYNRKSNSSWDRRNLKFTIRD